jgi:hypothetical protein
MFHAVEDIKGSRVLVQGSNDRYWPKRGLTTLLKMEPKV